MYVHILYRCRGIEIDNNVMCVVAIVSGKKSKVYMYKKAKKNVHRSTTLEYLQLQHRDQVLLQAWISAI